MDIKELSQKMQELVTTKGWDAAASLRPQTPRNLAISLSLEANEVLELFQWSERCAQPDELPGELADVALYLLQLAAVSGIDLEQAILNKLQYNLTRQWDQDRNT
jgi:NTP pyrophosphatase (non-canonical NTP hydrolase)